MFPISSGNEQLIIAKGCNMNHYTFNMLLGFGLGLAVCYYNPFFPTKAKDNLEKTLKNLNELATETEIWLNHKISSKEKVSHVQTRKNGSPSELKFQENQLFDKLKTDSQVHTKTHEDIHPSNQFTNKPFDEETNNDWIRTTNDMISDCQSIVTVERFDVNGNLESIDVFCPNYLDCDKF